MPTIKQNKIPQHYIALKETNIDTFNEKSNELIEKGFLPIYEPFFQLDKYNNYTLMQFFIAEELFMKIAHIKNKNVF